MSIKDKLSYFAFRAVGFPFSLLPYSWLHAVGRGIGSFLFLLPTRIRKLTLNNLAIAGYNASDRQRYARQSFQNLIITSLEYFRLPRSKGHINDLIVHRIDGKLREQVEGKGAVLAGLHQSNWEVPGLYISSMHPLWVVARTVPNPYAQKFLTDMRSMHGAVVAPPKDAVKEGFEALRKGYLVGFVADQVVMQGDYYYPLFGHNTRCSSAPALLAARCNRPVILSAAHRKDGKYVIVEYPAIWPDLGLKPAERVEVIMNTLWKQIEEHIRTYPGEWLWQHDRWRIHYKTPIKKHLRHRFIKVVCEEKDVPFLESLASLYEGAEITCYSTAPLGIQLPQQRYQDAAELFEDDWKTQMLVDLVGVPGLAAHHKKRSTFATVSADDLSQQQLTENYFLTRPLQPASV